MEPTKWEAEKISRNVLLMRWNAKNRKDLPSKILLIGDAHWDNPKCDRELLKFHLDEALAGEIPILIGGDFFCAMQGKWDKRSNKNDIRPEHQVGSYLDALVSTAAEFLDPYKHLIKLICRGNHETSILSHHETDLTERLVERLKAAGSAVESGGYAGWVKFALNRGHGDEKMRTETAFDMHYHHGFGGGGPVTMGKIDFNRYQVQVECDLMWSQHVHNTEIFDTKCATINTMGTVIHKHKWHIRTPTYKEEYVDGFGGFHVEKGRGPRPLGGVWLEFYRVRGNCDRFGCLPSRTRE